MIKYFIIKPLLDETTIIHTVKSTIWANNSIAIEHRSVHNNCNEPSFYLFFSHQIEQRNNMNTTA